MSMCGTDDLLLRRKGTISADTQREHKRRYKIREEGTRITTCCQR
jgi:hypothetical protein